MGLTMRKGQKELLSLLQSANGKLVPHVRIVAELYGETSPPATNSVQVIVCRLRKAGHPIRAHKGLGYSLGVPQG